jgi:hypothetical protein
MRNLTPLHLRCHPSHCPSIHELDDGSLLIVGKSATMAAALERIPVGVGELAVIVSEELLAGVVPGWKTIDSAPKDGTVILIWCPLMAGEKMHIVRWNGMRGRFPWEPPGGESSAIAAKMPTHWLPLPLPPAEKVEA